MRQIFVYGNNENDYLVAVIVSNGELDLLDLNDFGRKHGLSSSEEIRKFLLGDEFTISNGLLTPTHKVKRRAILDKYKNELVQLFE